MYHGSLSAAALPDSRVLSVEQREEIARNGLGDREGSVRKAVAEMLGGWVDKADGDLLEVNTSLGLPGLVDRPSQFLSRFDVLSSQVAEEALVSVFVTRPEVVDVVDFDGEAHHIYLCAQLTLRAEAFWADLTPAKAFLIRVFGEHCKLTNKVSYAGHR